MKKSKFFRQNFREFNNISAEGDRNFQGWNISGKYIELLVYRLLYRLLDNQMTLLFL